MNPSPNDTPEELAKLRRQVKKWVKRAAKAVRSFHNEGDGSFYRDSKKFMELNAGKKEHLSATTTSRAYLALAHADRCLADSKSVAPKWCEWFETFLKKPQFQVRDRVITQEVDDEKLNSFDIAHLADLVFVAEYLERFYGKPDVTKTWLKKPTGKRPGLKEEVATILVKNLEAPDESVLQPLKNHVLQHAQMAFELDDKKNWHGHHYFVTLHSLRALAILKEEGKLRAKGDFDYDYFVDMAKQFCVKECFHSYRRSYQLDTVRLVFAGVLYCLYAKPVDTDLSMAIIEALAAAQQENGSWPATHPIFREKARPWHITSHEVALCLTWLYFEPRLPDAARPLLLSMMEKYFLNWVVPTYTQITPLQKAGHEFQGWFDDHTISGDSVVGWATAIVCHFLVNYHDVLSNRINQSVIECLGIEACSTGYEINENSVAFSERWRKEEGKKKTPIATWPDIAQFLWTDNEKSDELSDEISWQWTDPSEGSVYSERLARDVLCPVLKSPAGRPEMSLSAGMLPGSPGTRKTTLVKTIASVLEWPMVVVPASVIFDRGFDHMESRANEVFRRLNYLSNCVVFFDEFEEFFRDRGEPGTNDNGDSENRQDSLESTAAEEDSYSIHDRTIAAFTTSAMLPRLQDLHDENRCLIFFATNYLWKVDAAVKRAGRFDFKLTIEAPGRERVLEYLEHPTMRTFTTLGMEVNEDKKTVGNRDKKTWEEIRDAVREAVKRTCPEDEHRREGDPKVPFKHVEAALQEALNANSNKGARVQAAIQSLEDSRESANSKDTPPDLILRSK